MANGKTEDNIRKTIEKYWSFLEFERLRGRVSDVIHKRVFLPDALKALHSKNIELDDITCISCGHTYRGPSYLKNTADLCGHCSSGIPRPPPANYTT